MRRNVFGLLPALTTVAVCAPPPDSTPPTAGPSQVVLYPDPPATELTRPLPIHFVLSPAPDPVPVPEPMPDPASEPNPAVEPDPVPPPGPDPVLPPPADCRPLTTLAAAAQIALLTDQPDCLGAFVDYFVANADAHVDAYLMGVQSEPLSDGLWQASYDAHAAGRFRFAPATLDALTVRLATAVRACPGTLRCQDWVTWILEPMQRGKMYTCPAVAHLSVADLLLSLPYGDYHCTESTIEALAPLANLDAVANIVDVARSFRTDWGRRNGLRALGRFAERGGESAPGRYVLSTLSTTVARTAAHAAEASPSEAVVHDAIWLLDAFFYPYFEMQEALQRRALDGSADDTLRFRAISAWSRLIWVLDRPLGHNETDFLRDAFAFSDPWVRAQAAYTVELVPAPLLSSGVRTALANDLHAAYARESELVARVYQARALDRLQGTQLAAAVRADFEATALPRTATTASTTLRTGLPADELAYWTDRIATVEDAFFAAFGSAVDTPVSHDPNPRRTVFVFATRAEYRAYMDAFVGFGAHAGGLYLERSATLYTYQRTPAESTYTLEELLQHELTHALTGRFVFPGIWGDAGFHAQPKGWLDEGLAEWAAGLVPGADDPLPLRPVPLGQLCTRAPATVTDLINRRAGYDQAGTFDYASAWAFVYYLQQHAPETLARLIRSFRRGSYAVADFAEIAHVDSVASLQADWHAAITDWCSTHPTLSGAHAHLH